MSPLDPGTIAAAFDLGTTWTIIAIGLSGVFTAPSTTTMLFLRSHLSRPELKAQVFTVGAGLRTSASAAGAALAGTAAGLSAGLTLAGVGLVWVASAAIMLAYLGYQRIIGPAALAPDNPNQVLVILGWLALLQEAGLPPLFFVRKNRKNVKRAMTKAGHCPFYIYGTNEEGDDLVKEQFIGMGL